MQKILSPKKSCDEKKYLVDSDLSMQLCVSLKVVPQM